MGELHYGRKLIQPNTRELRTFYQHAHPLLRFDYVPLTAEEINIVANSFATTIEARQYTCYACAIMPDHVHLCIRRHRDQAEEMLVFLQEASKVAVLDAKQRVPTHPVWGGPGWKVFLDMPDDVRRTVKYIDSNPEKSRMEKQSWPFVSEYDGWVPGGWRWARVRR